MNIRAWVIPWYRKEDWSRWSRMCNFTGTHKDWLKMAEAGAKQRERLGHHVARVVIDPDEFQRWSRINGGKIDGEAQIKFATTVFERQQSSGD